MTNFNRKIPILYIRADGNNILGIGHLMRCFVLSEEWIQAGGECVFIVSDTVSKAIVEQHGFIALTLYSSWNDLNLEVISLLDVVKSKPITLMLIDSYYYTREYIEALNSFCTTICIGDKTNGESPANLIIDYNLYANYDNYTNIYNTANTKFLLGSSYFPLRKEFINQPSIDLSLTKNIFFTTGSTDPLNIIPVISNKLLFLGYAVYVATTSSNIHLSILENINNKNSNFHLYIDNTNIFNIISNCSIALSTSGVTLLELCSIGIPTIAFSIVNNQLRSAEALAKEKASIYVGDIRYKTTEKIDMIISGIHALSQNPILQQELSKNMKRLVDGKGSTRIINEIKKLYKENET